MGRLRDLFAASQRVLGPSWGVLGAPLGVFGRLAAVLGRLGGVLGASWGVLGTSWGRLGASPRETMRKTPRLTPKMHPLDLKNQAPAAGRARFFKNRILKLTSIFNSILVSFCFHFGTQNRSWGVLGRLGASWERLGSSWEHLGKILEVSWVVLGRLRSVVEASWKHLGLSYRHIG